MLEVLLGDAGALVVLLLVFASPLAAGLKGWERCPAAVGRRTLPARSVIRRGRARTWHRCQRAPSKRDSF